MPDSPILAASTPQPSGKGNFATPRRKARLPATGNRIARCVGALALLLVRPLTATVFVAGTAATARASTSREYDLKAAFLFNFATFIEWPPEAFTGPDAPFVIGIYGQDPFGSALREVTAGENVNGHPFIVRRCDRIEEAARCHILFISDSESTSASALLRALAGRPILTVADMPRFLRTGGIVQFRTDSRVRLSINAAAAREAGLTISSKLLRVAEVEGTEAGR